MTELSYCGRCDIETDSYKCPNCGKPFSGDHAAGSNRSMHGRGQ